MQERNVGEECGRGEQEMSAGDDHGIPVQETSTGEEHGGGRTSSQRPG